MRILALLLVLLSAGGAALAQRGGVVITKNEVRAAAPETVTRRIFGGIAPLMLPLPDRGRPGVRPRRPLRQLAFFTLPNAANAAGLCRTEFVVVEFAPTGPPAGADTRVQPRRITSAPAYFVRDPARLRAGHPNEDEAEDEDEESIAAACAATDPRRVHIISAPDDHQVETALRLLLDLAEATRAGRAPVPLDCSDYLPTDPAPAEARCLAEFARLGTEHILQTRLCDPPVPAVCHQIDTGDSAIYLTMNATNQRLAGAKMVAMIVSGGAPVD